MNFKTLFTIAIAVFSSSGSADPGKGMDGTYMAEKASLSVYAFLPVTMYLVVSGENAYILLQGPNDEKKVSFKSSVDGNRLILGSRTDSKDQLIFYRRPGSSVILECLRCQQEGLPVVWSKVLRGR